MFLIQRCVSGRLKSRLDFSTIERALFDQLSSTPKRKWLEFKICRSRFDMRGAQKAQPFGLPSMEGLTVIQFDDDCT